MPDFIKTMYGKHQERPKELHFFTKKEISFILCAVLAILVAIAYAL